MSSSAISQGLLNRIRASVTYATAIGLNVQTANLGKGGISAVFTSASAVWIPTMTGGVPSNEPYQEVEITIHLLRTQGLGVAYRQQIESNCVVGDLTVIPDTSNFPDYPFLNCVIVGDNNSVFNGTDPEFVIQLRGAYNINSSLFNAG